MQRRGDCPPIGKIRLFNFELSIEVGNLIGATVPQTRLQYQGTNIAMPILIYVLLFCF